MDSITQVNLCRNGGKATVTLKTPNGVNVLSAPVLENLARELQKLDNRTRFLLLRAEGKVFAAGANIKDMQGMDYKEALSMSRKGHEVLDVLEKLPAITIAVINGAALGGGLELALACDFRLAVEKASLGLPETGLGLIPGWGGTIRLPRLIGPGPARRLIYSAGLITAHEALGLGLVDQVFPDPEGLEKGAESWLQQFKKGGPVAISRAKAALRGGNEGELFAQCFQDPEAVEGIGAFLEKRAAKWIT